MVTANQNKLDRSSNGNGQEVPKGSNMSKEQIRIYGLIETAHKAEETFADAIGKAFAPAFYALADNGTTEYINRLYFGMKTVQGQQAIRTHLSAKIMEVFASDGEKVKRVDAKGATVYLPGTDTPEMVWKIKPTPFFNFRSKESAEGKKDEGFYIISVGKEKAPSWMTPEKAKAISETREKIRKAGESALIFDGLFTATLRVKSDPNKKVKLEEAGTRFVSFLKNMAATGLFNAATLKHMAASFPTVDNGTPVIGYKELTAIYEKIPGVGKLEAAKPDNVTPAEPVAPMQGAEIGEGSTESAPSA